MSGDSPWVDLDLEITPQALSAIEEEARRTYPDEGCGLVLGPLSKPTLLDEALVLENEADKYHRLDPETFPRTARTYFKLNELKAARAFDDARSKGRAVKVIFHSHCDTTAHFSAEDTATFSQQGILMWPCAFIVLSVVGGEVVDRKLWVHVSGDDRFVERDLKPLHI